MTSQVDNWIKAEESHHRIRNRLNETLSKHNLTLNELYVLYYLCDAQNHQLAIKDFCGNIDLSLSALSRLIGHMSTKSCGVIERIPNQNDKRSTLIHLTSQGEKVLQTAIKDVNTVLLNEQF